MENMNDDLSKIYQNSSNSLSYNEMYKELYGDGSNANNSNIPNQAPNPYIHPTNVPNYNNGINYANTVHFSNVAPNQNVIIDNVANLNYVKNGYNNVSVNTSQYGLADLEAKDWFKYNMFLMIPIFNVFFFLYYGFMKTFIKYPSLKEWSKSAIVTSVCINIFYAIVILMLI